MLGLAAESNEQSCRNLLGAVTSWKHNQLGAETSLEQGGMMTTAVPRPHYHSCHVTSAEGKEREG